MICLANSSPSHRIPRTTILMRWMATILGVRGDENWSEPQAHCEQTRQMSGVQWRLSSSASSGPSESGSGNLSISGKRKSKSKSNSFGAIEIFFFVVWLIFTALSGFYFGYDPSTVSCPEVAPIAPKVVAPIKPQPCPAASSKVRPEVFSTDYPDNGYTYDELKSVWKCSHAVGNISQLNKDIFPSNINLQKTKWKSIVTVEPKAFFEKYLSQYPGDTRATQPVLIFSHKPLANFDEVGDVCKVLDIAVVPDRPGVCVAVTETYHDVASYHMLHAERQSNGKFALSANFVDGRALPSENHYKVARSLLLDYFDQQEKVMAAVRDIPKYGNGKVTVGVLIEDSDDMELFLNSYASAKKQGVSPNKFAIFTTNAQVQRDLSKTGIKIVYLPQLANIGKNVSLNGKFRRNFLQAWFAFACANALIKMMWQNPGTIWMERPDNIVKEFPITETSWSFKGRKDKRAAPFFISFDFFVAQGKC